MKLLLTNDDGIWAPGIRALALFLAQNHDVHVVAPSEEQSAMSNALTVRSPLYVKHWESEGVKWNSVTGTPTDCVKYALSYYCEGWEPDLVISGINNGYNLGSDALYSGTIGAAMEAHFYGYPSMALSMERMHEERLAEVVPFLARCVERFYGDDDYKGLLNVNVPTEALCTMENLRFVKQGRLHYHKPVQAGTNPKGDSLYWIGGKPQHVADVELTDVNAVDQGFVTVVPLQWVQEATADLRDLQKKYEA